MTDLTTRTPAPTAARPPIRPATLRAAWRAIPVLRRTTVEPTMTARTRAIVAAVALAVLIIGAVTRFAGLPTVGSALLAGFLVFGVGAAACLSVRPLAPISFALYSAAFGLAVTTGVGFAMAETGVWFPRVAFVLVAAAAAVFLVRALRRDLTEFRTASRSIDRTATDRTGLLVSLTAVVGLVVTAGASIANAGLPQTDGLLLSVGPAWYVGCALIAAAFAAAVWTRVSPAAPVLAAGSVVILSQALMYGAPTVMAAARHLGLMNYILANGGTDASQDIYQAWPGLFAGSAFISAGTGLTDLLALATWWPVLITPFAVLAVRALAGRFVSPQRAWIAAAVYALGDAVNSIYFAPQVFGFVLALTVLTLLVATPSGESLRQRNLRLGIALGLILPIVVAHQISPFMLGLALLALVLFRLVDPWWTPLLAFVPAIGWALLHQKLLARYIDPGAIGSLFSNIAPPEHPEAVAGMAAATTLVFYIPAAALVVFGLITALVVIRRHDRLHFGLAAAMVSPLGLALATNYGQEGVFRIVLFALPWLAILVASVRLPSRFAARLVLIPAFAIMMAVNSYGQSGLDWARIMRAGDAEVTSAFETTAPDKATLLSMGTKNATPTRITDRYDEVGYTSRLRVGGMPNQVGSAYDPRADLDYLTVTYASTYAPGGHYLYVSDAIGAYDDRYGLQRYSDYLRLKEAVATSSAWELVTSSDTAQLYKLRVEPPVSR